MNVPGDWSWGNLKNKAGGLLDDPNAAMENPWFRMGMGLLSENSKPFGGDPFGAGILGGMQGAKETKQQNADQKRIEELRRKIAEWLQQQQLGAMGGQQMPGGAWQTPLPQNQQPPRSIMDMMRTTPR